MFYGLVPVHIVCTGSVIEYSYVQCSTGLYQFILCVLNVLYSTVMYSVLLACTCTYCVYWMCYIVQLCTVSYWLVPVHIVCTGCVI